MVKCTLYKSGQAKCCHSVFIMLRHLLIICLLDKTYILHTIESVDDTTCYDCVPLTDGLLVDQKSCRLLLHTIENTTCFITSNDEFSKYICESCLKQLMASHAFRNQCLRSMERLEKYLETSKLNMKYETDVSEDKPFNLVDCIINSIKTETDGVKNYDITVPVDSQKQKTSVTVTSVSTEIGSDLEKKCPYCNEVRVDLKSHIRRIHRNVINEENKQESENTPSTKPEITSKELIIKKKRANKSNKTDIKNTIKNEIPEKKLKGPRRRTVCYICGISVTCLSNHMISHNVDGVEYICDFCGTSFKSKYTLLAHFKIHLNKREYKCTMCPKTFNQDTSLRIHMHHHTGEKNYESETCHRRFGQASGLSTHIPSHLKIYKYPCSLCGKLFTRTSGRKKHERTHSDEHPYRCPYCPKTFKASSSYSVHMTQHFKDTFDDC